MENKTKILLESKQIRMIFFMIMYNDFKIKIIENNDFYDDLKNYFILDETKVFNSINNSKIKKIILNCNSEDFLFEKENLSKMKKIKYGNINIKTIFKIKTILAKEESSINNYQKIIDYLFLTKVHMIVYKKIFEKSKYYYLLELFPLLKNLLEKSSIRKLIEDPIEETIINACSYNENTNNRSLYENIYDNNIECLRSIINPIINKILTKEIFEKFLMIPSNIFNEETEELKLIIQQLQMLLPNYTIKEIFEKFKNNTFYETNKNLISKNISNNLILRNRKEFLIIIEKYLKKFIEKDLEKIISNPLKQIKNINLLEIIFYYAK